MKDWKEVPHLFCNGKFKILYRRGVYTLNGLQIIPDTKTWMICELGININLKNCQLLARPNSDMTDEEIYHLTGLTPDQQDYHAENNYLNELIEESLDSREGFIYALSIGVLPDEYWNESVININEVN